MEVRFRQINAADPPACGTAWTVAARKEHAFTEALRDGAVETFDEVRPAHNGAARPHPWGSRRPTDHEKTEAERRLFAGNGYWR
ncbi:hypothetical protein GCM10010215_19790 [Streptomyces virginiae]|uniref:Uncharacterized protein n=1 Tax=Streptomyces virginiae TaxID=1961 RepID=A0ABQ3NQU6_STRVG|nr:hypothetical protein GCM10010215_19790 [Streptomyces virginiae]GHI15141.1 hypothetical protein Scinn_46040 [Streptomyces virginiae]